MMTRLFTAAVILIFCTVSALAQDGIQKKKPRPYQYGGVVIDNFSSKAKMAPVTFDHWPHRAKFSCRLCHVDIGFAMTAGASEVTAADNMHGYFCGTCHDGQHRYDDRPIFAACADQPRKEDLARCARCHGTNRRPEREKGFAEFATRMPHERFGNGIDWEKAENTGLIKPVQYLEGASRPELMVQKDFALPAKMEGMTEIIFSHQKHTIWNGCELCHPEIFLGVRKGASKYTMVELFEGKYCGVCHDKVAFPQTDCQRCHIRSEP